MAEKFQCGIQIGYRFIVFARLVFGFATTGATTKLQFASDDVYELAQLLDSRTTTSGGDWALVRLDRPVIGRAPVNCRTEGKIGDHASVYVVGYPLGLPQKIAANAKVRSNSLPDVFFANLDAFGGDSGAPVVNLQTDMVEGIIVRFDSVRREIIVELPAGLIGLNSPTRQRESV